MRTCLAIAVCILVLSVGARAEDVPPALLVKTDETSEPLAVESVRTEVMIHGFLAETSMTLTFRNPHDRVLAGDLYFPLPEGSTVAGYALDIDEKMIPGVVVTKEKARVVFEKEMRKGVDPGIVEWTKGNTFKTRVFPIPANGTRTVRVRYVSEIDTAEGSPRYVLPLNFKDKVKSFALDVKVMKALPKTAGMFAARGDFAQEEEGVLEFHWQEADAPADEDFVVMLQYAEGDVVMVETDEDGRTWFCTAETVIVDNHAAAAKSPRHVGVLWDASASRGKSDHAKELSLLQNYLQVNLPSPPNDLPEGMTVSLAPLTVEVVLFRNAAEPTKTFDCNSSEDVEKLIAYLKQVKYDGGTTLSAAVPAGVAGTKAELYLLFTDGLHTFGREKEVVFPAPVYAFSEDTSTDPAALQALCARSGGQYVNLKAVNETVALETIGDTATTVKTLTAKTGDVDELYPHPGTPVIGDRLVVCGRLKSERAEVAGSLSTGADVAVVPLDRRDAVAGDLLRTYWAQRKLQHLLLDKAANADALVAHGREHRIVTPGTSLIVLETLEQYVEHEILPPRALPEMRAEYARLMEQRGAQEKQETESKIQRVLAMWNERVQWWNQEFKVPKDFKYDGPAAGEEVVEEEVIFGEGRAVGGVARGGGAARAAMRVDSDSGVSAGREDGERRIEISTEPAEPEPGDDDGLPEERRITANAQDLSAVTVDHFETDAAIDEDEKDKVAEAAPAPWTLPATKSATAAASREEVQSAEERDGGRLQLQRAREVAEPHVTTADIEVTDHLETDMNKKLEDKPEDTSTDDDGLVDTPAVMGVDAPSDPDGVVRRDLRALPSEERERESLEALRADSSITVGGNAEAAVAMQAVAGDAGPSNAADPGVALSGWKPDAPYLTRIKEAGEGKRLSTYLAERTAHGEAPSFYLEAADLFLDAKDRASAIRVLSNIAELELENAALLRVLAHRLAQIGELDLAAATFEEVKRMRPEEPQSYRDLALVYEQLGRAEEAAKLLYHVVMHQWDRFDQIEVIALMELNRLGAKHNLDLAALGVDPRLVKNLPVDLRVVMTWDADMTDIDLWVTEPTKEVCLYSHNRTAIGGALSRDFTQGYGPEEYVLKKARPGVYEIRAHYYGSQSVTLTGSVTVQATVYTNYGRPNETRQAMTLRLRQKEDKYLVGKIEF